MLSWQLPSCALLGRAACGSRRSGRRGEVGFPDSRKIGGRGIANAVLFKNLTGRLDELLPIEDHGLTRQRAGFSEFESYLAVPVVA